MSKNRKNAYITLNDKYLNIFSKKYLHKYNLKVLGAITAGDIDQHITVPRSIDDGMIVFLICQ